MLLARAVENLERAIEVPQMEASVLEGEYQLVQGMLPLHARRSDDRAGRAVQREERRRHVVGGADALPFPRHWSGQRGDLTDAAGKIMDQVDAMAPAGIMHLRRDADHAAEFPSPHD